MDGGSCGGGGRARLRRPLSAMSRRYRYTLLNDSAPDPFLAATTWHVEGPLDLRALRLACDPLIGEHDFSSFCGARSRRRASRPRRWSAGSSRRGGTRSASPTGGCCASRSRPTPSAADGAAPSPARWSRWVWGSARPARLIGTLRAHDRATAGQLRPPTACASGKSAIERGRGPQPHPELMADRAATVAARSAMNGGGAGPERVQLPRGRSGRILTRLPCKAPVPARQAKEAVMRTYSPKASEITRAWHVIDADGLVLGRLCTEIGPPAAGQAQAHLRPPPRHRRPRDRRQRRQGGADLRQGRPQARLPPLRLPGRAQAARPTPSCWPASPRRPSAARCGACSPRARSAARC